MLLDEDISETKPLICEAVEELFTDESLIVYLENIFYAKPLPPSADTENALAVCESQFTENSRMAFDFDRKTSQIYFRSEKSGMKSRRIFSAARMNATIFKTLLSAKDIFGDSS